MCWGLTFQRWWMVAEGMMLLFLQEYECEDADDKESKKTRAGRRAEVTAAARWRGGSLLIEEFEQENQQ